LASLQILCCLFANYVYIYLLDYISLTNIGLKRHKKVIITIFLAL